MYVRILASAIVLLVALRVLGGVLGNRVLKKGSVAGLVVAATIAALNWILLGWSPLPAALVRLVEQYLPN